MLVAISLFTVTSVLVREAARHIPIFEIVFLRQLMANALLLPLYWRHRAQIMHPTGLVLHGARGAVTVVSMMCGLAATAFIPFADVTAIQMSEVLFITALAALFLGEKIGWRRWSAAAVGFAGVIVMLRPFAGPIEHYMLIALVGSVFGAVSVMTLRMGSTHDTAETVMFFQAIIVTVCSFPLALWVWTPPGTEVLFLVFLMSLALAASGWFFTKAFRMGRASAVAPLNYLRLLMMAATGYWLYGETPTLTTVLGAALIVGAATYTLHRNSVRQAEARK